MRDRRDLVGPRTAEVPRLLHIAPDARFELTELLSTSFDLTDVVVVSGSQASRTVADDLVSDLRQRGGAVRHVTGPDGSATAATEMLEVLDRQRPTAVVAVGGGRPIDVAKLAASRAKVDLVAVPTVLSHDGMCSPVASLTADDNVRRSMAATTPAGVIVDTRLVGQAPIRFLRAGVGDLVSNITAVADWHLARKATGEPIDELASSIAILSAKSVLDIDWPPTDDDVATIARGLVMSGLAMEIAGSSRPCSGGEHLISHALDEITPGNQRLHGEQVALGTRLLADEHRDRAVPDVDAICQLFDRVGFTGSAGWDIDGDTVVAAIQRAPQTRPGRYTLLDEVDTSPTALRSLVARIIR